MAYSLSGLIIRELSIGNYSHSKYKMLELDPKLVLDIARVFQYLQRHEYLDVSDFVKGISEQVL